MDKDKNTMENKPLRSKVDIAMEETGVEVKDKTGELKTVAEIAMNKKDGETNWNVKKAEQKDTPDQKNESERDENEKIPMQNSPLRTAQEIVLENTGVTKKQVLKTPDGDLRSDSDIANERVNKIIEKGEGQPEKIEKTEEQIERDKEVDSAIKRVLDAEDEFKKKEKSQKKFEGLVSRFKMVINKDKEGEKKDSVTREYNKVKAEKDQAKKAMNDLIKQYARGDIESGKTEFATKIAMLKDKDRLENERIKKQDKPTQGWIKKGLEKWHKQGILKQVAITGAFIMGGEALIAFGGLTAIVGGTMVAGMATLEAVATATGVEKMIGSGQKWYRKKHGMTKEAKTEEARKEFVGEEEDDEQGIENLLKNFDQHDIDLNKKLGEVFKVEHRDKIIRWTVAVAAGLAVGGLRASHAIAKMKKGAELGTKSGMIASDVRAVNEEKLAEIVGQGTKEVEKLGPRINKVPFPSAGESGQISRMQEAVTSAKELEFSSRGVAEKGIEAVAKSAGETAGSLAKQVAENPDKFKAVVEAGSSQWKTAEGLLGEVEGLGFKSMELEQQSHFIDSIIKEVGKNDLVKTGEKLDFSKALGNKSFMEKLIERNKEIAKGTKEFINIGKNNAAIEKWAVANPGKALNTETVKGIIGGSKNVVDKAAKAGETFATSLKGVPTSAVAAEKATFEAIKTIGAGIKKLPEFAGESGVWAQTSDMSVYKFMEDSAKGAIEMSEKIGGVSNAVSKRAMTGEEAKVIKLLRDYIIKIGDIGGKAGRPGKGQTVMEYINAFRAKNGRPLYNGLGEFVSKVKSGDMPIRV